MNELRKPSKKSLLAFLLAVCICITMLPASALKAAEEQEDFAVYALENEDKPSRCIVSFHYPRDFYYDEDDESGTIRKIVQNGSIMAAPAEYLENEDGQRHIIGWTLDQSDHTPFDFDNTPITANTPSEAKRGWNFYPILDRYKIKFYDTIFHQKHNPVYADPGTTIAEVDLSSSLEGVTFDGWEARTEEDEDGDYTSYDFDFSQPINSDLSLYAQWSGYVTVRFEYPDDFDGHKRLMRIGKGSMISKPEAVSNGKRSIIDWIGPMIVTEGVSERFDFSQPVNFNMTIQPVVDKYCVTFDGDDYYNKRVYVEKNQTVAEPQLGTIESWQGTFGGWYYWGDDIEGDYGKVLFDFSKPITQDYELRIKWNEKYNVTFHYPNDFRDYDDYDWYDKTELRISEGQKIQKPQISENNGKRKIIGWTKSMGGTEKFDFSKPLARTDLDEDEELHLYPILDLYMMEFRSDSTDYYEAVYVQPGEKVTKPKDPAREHYTFAGWRYYDSKKRQWETFDFQTPVNQDYDLEADWQKAYSFIIKLWDYDSEDYEYDWDDFDQAKYCYITNGTSYSDAVFAAKDYPTLARAGYDFAGWYYDKACTIECAKDSGFDPQYKQYEIDWDEDINLILYAGWKKSGTDVALGYCDVKRYEYRQGKPQYMRSYCVEKGTVIPGLDVRTGKGERADGIRWENSGSYYTDEKKQNVFDIKTPVTENMNIYWAGNYKFNIEYNLVSYDGITTCTEEMAADYFRPSLLNLPTPRRAGYTFTGWYTDPGCVGKYESGLQIHLISRYAVGNRPTLFAGWQRQDTGIIDYSMPNINYHTITFAYNYKDKGIYEHAMVEPGQSAAYYKGKMGDPVITGHYFAGWYMDADGKTPFNFNMAPASDIIVYAKWGTNQEGSVITPQNGTEVPGQEEQNRKKEVEKVTLSQTYAVIPKKEHIQLKASVTPIDAVNASVSWRSSDEKVATVVSGKVTANKAGTATIYAKTDNGKEAACKILVADVTLNAMSAVLQVGKSTNAVQIAANYPSSDSVKSYKSSNESIVKVNKKGKITAGRKTGTAMITVTMKSGASVSYKVTVQKGKVTTKSLKLNAKSIKLKTKKSIMLKAMRNPISASEKITWSSSNKKVAKVDKKGKVKALKKGQTKIIAKTSNGKKATCKVIVK